MIQCPFPSEMGSLFSPKSMQNGRFRKSSPSRVSETKEILLSHIGRSKSKGLRVSVDFHSRYLLFCVCVCDFFS